jgi:DNA-binding beta-propeller fold protein YncE
MADDGKVFVADSYNHKVINSSSILLHFVQFCTKINVNHSAPFCISFSKYLNLFLLQIKLVDPKLREVRTVYGNGQAGDVFEDDPLHCSLNEPGGLAYDSHSHRLFIADTNNHIVKLLDTKTNTPGLVRFSTFP